MEYFEANTTNLTNATNAETQLYHNDTTFIPSCSTELPTSLVTTYTQPINTVIECNLPMTSSAVMSQLVHEGDTSSENSRDGDLPPDAVVSQANQVDLLFVLRQSYFSMKKLFEKKYQTVAQG